MSGGSFTHSSGGLGGVPDTKVYDVPVTAPVVGPNENAGPHVSARAVPRKGARAAKVGRIFVIVGQLEECSRSV